MSHELNTLLTLDADAYNADREAVRKGWLDLVARSPAHLKSYLDGEQPEPTEALEFGQLVHAFVLEPDLVSSRYYRLPEADKRTNVGKALVAEAAAANPGKRGFKADAWDLGIKLRDAVYGDRTAKAVLGQEGAFEQSTFWQNDDTSLLCKCRYDFVSPRKVFAADIKTTMDASDIGFGKSIWEYRYDVQAAHYTESNGLRFILIAIEKKPPYALQCFPVDDDTLGLGQRRRLPNLRAYADAKTSGNWPGYGFGMRRIKLPPYARIGR